MTDSCVETKDIEYIRDELVARRGGGRCRKQQMEEKSVKDVEWVKLHK